MESISVTVHDVIDRRAPCPMPGKPVECIQVEESLHLRSGDVFIATYPKTGTTVLQYMCHLLRTQGNHDDFEDIHQVCPHISSSWFIGQDLNDPSAIHNSFSPRLFKSHRELEQIAAFTPGIKYIATIRNPVNTLYSMYSFRSSRGSTSNCSLLDFSSAPMWTTAKLPGCSGSLFDHLVTLWRCRHCSNLLVIPYEDLVSTPAAILPIIAAFLSVPCSSELVATIVEKTSREAMLKQTSKFDESWCAARMEQLGRHNAAVGVKTASKVNKEESLCSVRTNIAAEEEATSVTEMQDKLWAEKVAPVTGMANYESLRAEMMTVLMSRG